MNDLISKPAAIDLIRKMAPEFFSAYQHEVYVSKQNVAMRLMALPPVQLEQKKGKWIKHYFYENALMCSCCKAHLDKEDWSRHYFYFCYHCGAFMEGMDCDADMREEKTDG